MICSFLQKIAKAFRRFWFALNGLGGRALLPQLL